MLGAKRGKRAEAQPHLNREGSPEIDPGGVGRGGHCHSQAGHRHLGGQLWGEGRWV